MIKSEGSVNRGREEEKGCMGGEVYAVRGGGVQVGRV